MKKELNKQEATKQLKTLNERFDKNKTRHEKIAWKEVEAKLESNPGKLWSLCEMEKTGGEPDVVGFDKQTGEFIFMDCSKESPSGRRSFCYDREALNARKEHKPKNSAIDIAEEIGITILTEEEYREMQKVVKMDHKTSSWVFTPKDIRTLGGAIFCDFRYGKVFTYHNGAESYYAARGFRGKLKV